MASSQEQEVEKPSHAPPPEPRFQFESRTQSDGDGDGSGNSIGISGDRSQTLDLAGRRPIAIAAAQFRRTVEQNDCHSFLSSNQQQYLATHVSPDRRTIAQDFLESSHGSPSFWVCNIKHAYTTLKYSTNLRCVEPNVAPGTYSVAWSFAYIYRAGQWTPLYHKDFLLLAGRPVSEHQFMARTTDPEQDYLGHVNKIIYRDTRAETYIRIPIVQAGEQWRLPAKQEGYLAQSFRVVARGLEVVEGNNSVAFLVRKVAGGKGDGQVYFLGCELIPAPAPVGEAQDTDATETARSSPEQQRLALIDHAIANYEASLLLLVDDRAAQVGARKLLAKAYLDRYRASGDDHISCCDKSILHYEKALEDSSQLATCSVEDRVDCFTGLGDIFMERLLRRRSDRPESARRAEECFRAALGTQPDNWMILAKLAVILNQLYGFRRDESFLDDSLDLCQLGLVRASEQDDCYPLVLEACVLTIWNRSTRHGSADDLDTAVDLLRLGLALAVPLKQSVWRLQRLLAEVLCQRFRITPWIGDLDEAERLIEAADSADSLLVREQVQRSLTQIRVWLLRFQFTRHEPLVKRCLKSGTESMALLDKYACADSPDASHIMILLGHVLHEFNWRAGLPSDLAPQNIIQINCNRVAYCIPDPIADASLIWYLFQYGRASLNQYWEEGSEKVLEIACSHMQLCFEASFAHSDAEFPLHACTLSCILREQYGLSKNPAEREMARKCLRKALLARPFPITPDTKATLASEVSQHLFLRFEDTGDLAVLDQIIQIRRQAVQFASPYFRHRLLLVLSLARALLEKANRTQQLADFQLVNVELDLARKLVDEKKARKLEIRELRARLREAQWHCSKDNVFREAAIQLNTTIYTASFSSPREMIFAALRAHTLKWSKGDKKGATASLVAAERILVDFILSDGQPRNEQLRLIRKWHVIPILAALFRLVVGDAVADIVQSLETNRSILWDRVLNSRVDTSLLEDKHPELFERFQQVRLQLQSRKSDDRGKKAAAAATKLAIFNTPSALLEINVPTLINLGEKHAEILDLIRRQAGFEDFLRPLLNQEQIQAVASQGPIVMAIHYEGADGGEDGLCYAFIISNDDVTALPLPKFVNQDCAAQAGKLQEALAVQKSEPERASQAVEDVLRWIWTAAAEPILEHLGFTAASTTSRLAAGERRPRLWWVSCGWVNVLPMHAAGDHGHARATGEPCSVIDRVISSYTPTIRALEYARLCMVKMTTARPPLLDSSPSSFSGSLPTALVVAMPLTEGEDDLPHAQAEAEAVGAILMPVLSVRVLSGRAATKAEVVRILRHCALAHFACHGHLDAANPTLSRLCLHSKRRGTTAATAALSVAALMGLDMEACMLAFLSACDSAVATDAMLRDEGLHLAGALQMAGVPNAVATWWRISDELAVPVAKGFYEHLVVDCALRVESAAEALHAVTLALRDGSWRAEGKAEPLGALAWATYVHFGP